jgi:subtilisin-like proprotein convertase family protein
VAGQASKVFSGTISTQATLGTYTLLVKPGVRDLKGNALDQNRNAKGGEPADLYRVTTTLAASPNWSNPAKVAIRDLRTVTSVIAVPAGVTAQRIQVGLNISHGDLSDLYITLKSPAGRVFVLINRNAKGQNFRDLILEDSATTAFVDGVAPYAGTYRPTQAMGSLGGASVQGNWTLSITDRALVDQGTLNNWSLRFVSEGASGQRLQVHGSSFIASSGVSASMMGGSGSLLLSLGQEFKKQKEQTLEDFQFHEGVFNSRRNSTFSIPEQELAPHHSADFHAGANCAVNDLAFGDNFTFGPWDGELGVATGVATGGSASAGVPEQSKTAETTSRRFGVGPLDGNAAVAKRGERVVLAQNKIRLAGVDHIVRNQAKGPFGLGSERPEN